MRVSVPLVVMAALVGLAAVGCSRGDGGGNGSGDDGVGAVDAAGSEDGGQGTTTTTSTVIDPAGCSDTTTSTTTTGSTTTGSTTTSTLLDICAAFEDLPPEQAADLAEVWSGTVSGSIQTSGCTTASQNGTLALFVSDDGSVSGSGVTESGAYTCDNGAAIPVMRNVYAFTGTKTDRFSLSFTSGGAELASEPIQDGHTQLVQDTGAGVVTTDLECVQGC